jgi:DNA invertase Pin-like site-specific DNA recombinase
MAVKITKLDMPIIIPTRKRVAAYARVSSDKDAMLNSLAAQVDYFATLIKGRLDWEYAGVYVDEGITGTNDNRPEFQRLIDDCRAGMIDIVLTKSISRFARNTVVLLETVRELKLLNIDVFFEQQNIHSLSGEGELMLSIMASCAQAESLNVSENVKWRIRDNYKQGIPGGLCVYGYKMTNHELVIDPEEADVVRMVFSDYISGMGTNAISRKLNRMGITAKHGGKWFDGRIHDMLRCEKYVGDLVLQKYYCPDHLSKKLMRNDGALPQYIIHNNHDPIISRETFQRVQDEMERRKRGVGKDGSLKDKPKSSRMDTPHPSYLDNFQSSKPDTPRPSKPDTPHPTPHPFTGMIICANCGQHYRRKSAHGKDAWNCGTYIRFGKDMCYAKQIPDDILRQVCCEVLKLKQFDIDVVRRKVREIHVPAFNELIFMFHDGKQEQRTWEVKPRSEGWSDESRQGARERKTKYWQSARGG